MERLAVPTVRWDCTKIISAVLEEIGEFGVSVDGCENKVVSKYMPKVVCIVKDHPCMPSDVDIASRGHWGHAIVLCDDGLFYLCSGVSDGKPTYLYPPFH